MASFCCNDDNQVRDSFFSNARHGRSCSKAQACLEKILHTISTTPPPPPCEDYHNINPKKRGFEIDLNIRLCSIVDDEDDEVKSESLAENSFVGKNPDGDEEETEETQEKTADDSSAVTEMAKSDDFKSDGIDGEEKTAVVAAAVFNDSLDLLIEAAVMISGRDYNYVNEKKKEVEIEKSGGSMKRNNKQNNLANVNEEEEEGFEEIEEISPPVVRSTRGRSQFLPQRFRDSVLEPWKKKRPQNQRSTATAMVSKKKRRSR